MKITILTLNWIVTTLRMRYPSLNQFIKNNFAINSEENESIESSFKMIASY